MAFENQLETSTVPPFEPPRGEFSGNGRPGLRSPSFDNTAYMLM
jgi:hypothetical protein